MERLSNLMANIDNYQKKTAELTSRNNLNATSGVASDTSSFSPSRLGYVSTLYNSKSKLGTASRKGGILRRGAANQTSRSKSRK